MLESDAQKNIRIEAAKRGVLLWRNNVGACEDKNGRIVRYGIANDSKKLNDAVKSSDLIGVTPTLITPGHVGHVLGVITCVEVKKTGWRYMGTGREKAQKAWIDLVLSQGGYAQFATCPADIWGI